MTYQTSNPLARTSPLRSIPLVQSARGIIPFTPRQTAEQRYAHVCKALITAQTAMLQFAPMTLAA